MPPSKYFEQLANRCSNLAVEISDDNGFIAIQRLIDRFGVALIVRPMLVEGMLASSENEANGRDNNAHQWSLLIDSETHNVSDGDIKNEIFGTPLSPRFRNTVAHELAHSLAFRPTEFGVNFPKRFASEKTRREFVQQIEKETEKLSPLLLIPDSFLDRFFDSKKKKISIEELCNAKRSMGVSRSVFVNRLNLLSISDERRLKVHRPSLRNLAIGIGEWKSEGRAYLRHFPLYSFFDGGKVPNFIFKLQRRIEVSANEIFNDPGFILCGGNVDNVDCLVSAGTPRNPNLMKLKIRCSVEDVAPKNGANFLFIIQSIE